MSKAPINPVTIRGCLPDNAGKPSNLSIGRLWLGSKKTSDGPHRFNPRNPQPLWDKSVTFILWGLNMEEAKSVVGSDEDFILLVKRLAAQETIAAILWGKENSAGIFATGDSESRGILFDRTNKELRVTVYDDQKVALGGAVLNFDKFLDGLGHLYPKGELN